jgi:HSP20 family protein
MASRFLPSLYSSRGLSADPILGLHQEMNRLFDEAFRSFGLAAPAAGASAGAVGMPRLDVHETDKEVCIAVEVPGVQPSDLDVRLDGDIVTISGEKKNERSTEEKNYHVMERSFGRFTRSVQLPFEPQAEQVQADFKDGVLTLRVPRQPQQERSRRIEVRSSGGPAELGKQGQAEGQAQAQGQDEPGTGGEPTMKQASPSPDGPSAHH